MFQVQMSVLHEHYCLKSLRDNLGELLIDLKMMVGAWWTAAPTGGMNRQRRAL